LIVEEVGVVDLNAEVDVEIGTITKAKQSNLNE